MMISPLLDKKEYLETTSKQPEAAGSYNTGLQRTAGDESGFRSYLVKSQSSYIKEQLSKNENPRTLIQSGDLYLLKENYKRAIRDYRKVLDLNPGHIGAHEKIITALTLHKKHAEAEPYFRKLLVVTNNRYEIFRKYANFKVDMLFQHGGDADATLEIISEVLNLNNADAELLNTYGFILLNYKNDVAGARNFFERSLTTDPDYVHSINNLGICCLRENKLDEAEILFKKTTQLLPATYPCGYQNLALLYITRHNYNSAFQLLVNASKLGVSLGNSWDHLSGWLLVKKGEFKEAIAWYQKKLKVESRNELILNNLGYCYEKLGLPEQSASCFEEAVKVTNQKYKSGHTIDSRALVGFYNLGRIKMKKGGSGDVLEIAKQIQELDPENAFSYYLQGASEQMRQNYAEAKKYFARVLEVSENIPEVYPDYAFILECIEESYSAAAELLERALSRGFDTPLINNNLAYAYIKMGELDKAETVLTKVHKKDTIPTLIATQGLLEMRRGNIEKGNALYQEAIKQMPVRDKKIAMQIQLAELARYYLQQKDIHLAKLSIAEAKELPESYVSREVLQLEAELP